MNQDLSGRTIRPADFQSPDGTNEKAGSNTASASAVPVKAIAIIGLLLVVALATLLLLPNQITTTPTFEVSADSTASSEDIEQPFVDAQLLRARQDAQDILASFIEVQDQLEALKVNAWAPESYTEILGIAASGDAAYQQREFDQALQIYQQAEQAANDLLAQQEAFGEKLLTEAEFAFTNSDSAEAMEKYQLAQLLLPDSELAQQGIERTAVLDEVNDLKASAAEAGAEQEWNAAKELLQKAVNLDPLDQEAADLLAQAENETKQISFRQALAEGFNALADANYVDARSAFERADQLVPNNPTVADALVQVESASETSHRGGLMDQALEAESLEDWELAAEQYRTLLERDESNLTARVSLVRVEARAELDRKIEAILSNPAALQSDERWNDAEATLADARGVIEKTPGLIAQISELERVIRQARTPVELQILSDGRTQIEIYRIGRLGTLTDHRVNIYPGEYVVIGKRSGYRDVRKEIEIPGGASEISIRIEANEPI